MRHHPTGTALASAAPTPSPIRAVSAWPQPTGPAPGRYRASPDGSDPSSGESSVGGCRVSKNAADTQELATRYVSTLIARFAGHGRSTDPEYCRCGGTRPCSKERQIADLLDLFGGGW
jgi:hypothetical protein